MTTPSDLEVIAAIRSGRADVATGILWVKYGDAILRYCRHILGNAAQAEDVRQIVFLQTLRDLRRISKPEHIKSWIFKVAAYRCLDELKKSRNWSNHFDLEGELPEAQDPGEDVEVSLMDSERWDALYRCIQKLSPRLRKTVELRLEGLSFEEMAERCKVRSGTLRVRSTRAQDTLRDCLEAEGFGE